jgi:integrase
LTVAQSWACRLVSAGAQARVLVMARAGIEESAHAPRHTVATRLVREHGRELALVADVLGHADVKTARDYARSDLEDRRAALEHLAE